MRKQKEDNTNFGYPNEDEPEFKNMNRFDALRRMYGLSHDDGSDYSDEEVQQFLDDQAEWNRKEDERLGVKIEKMINSGYSDSRIVEYLSKK